MAKPQKDTDGAELGRGAQLNPQVLFHLPSLKTIYLDVLHAEGGLFMNSLIKIFKATVSDEQRETLGWDTLVPLNIPKLCIIHSVFDKS